MAIHGPKKGPNMVIFFPTHCFCTLLPGNCRRFRPKVLSQTPKKALFGQRSYSKGHNHALEKVLTNETPGITTCVQEHGTAVGSHTGPAALSSAAVNTIHVDPSGHPLRLKHLREGKHESHQTPVSSHESEVTFPSSHARASESEPPDRVQHSYRTTWLSLARPT